MLLFPGCLHIHFGFFSSAHILVNHFVFVSLGYYITKHRKLGGLVRNLFLSRFLEARKSKIKASADSMVRAHFLDSDFGFVVTLYCGRDEEISLSCKSPNLIHDLLTSKGLLLLIPSP